MSGGSGVTNVEVENRTSELHGGMSSVGFFDRNRMSEMASCFSLLVRL